MKEITGYKTRDGLIYEDKRQAERHETELDFNSWYSTNHLLGNCIGSYVNLDELKEYISENAERFSFLIEQEK